MNLIMRDKYLFLQKIAVLSWRGGHLDYGSQMLWDRSGLGEHLR